MTEIAPRIVVDEAIQGGRPVIQGTRVPVDIVIGKLAGGKSQEDVERKYGLVREDVLAAFMQRGASRKSAFEPCADVKRFLIDEDLPRSLAAALEASGMDAIHVVDAGLRGSPDEAVFEEAVRVGRSLITADLDFANVLRFPPGGHESTSPRSASSTRRSASRPGSIRPFRPSL